MKLYTKEGYEVKISIDRSIRIDVYSDKFRVGLHDTIRSSDLNRNNKNAVHNIIKNLSNRISNLESTWTQEEFDNISND